MCDLHDHHGLPPLEADEYVLDTPFVRELVAAVRERIDRSASAADACERIRPVFEQALMQRDWLPAEFKRDVPESGMGGGIGQWLLFRSADRSLCLFSLVVPPGSMTPIHDHLAWGLVGLYQGNQDEEFYDPGEGSIELTRRRPLAPGDYYVLLPPADDIHRVRTTSAETSVSIHLLANDTGCAERQHVRRPDRRGPPVSLRLRERDLRGGIRQLSRQAARTALAPSRPAAAVHAASVSAWTPVRGCSSRHFQLRASVVPGRFIRASVPRPSRSCAGTITSSFSTARRFCSSARCSPS